MERLTDGLPAEDRVRLVFQSTYLNFPIALPFLRVDELTVERFLARIEQVLQSYQHIRLDDRVDIHFVHMRMQKGGWNQTHGVVKIHNMLRDKTSVIQIKDNKTEMC